MIFLLYIAKFNVFFMNLLLVIIVKSHLGSLELVDHTITSWSHNWSLLEGSPQTKKFKFQTNQRFCIIFFSTAEEKLAQEPAPVRSTFPKPFAPASVSFYFSAPDFLNSFFQILQLRTFFFNFRAPAPGYWYVLQKNLRIKGVGVFCNSTYIRGLVIY